MASPRRPTLLVLVVLFLGLTTALAHDPFQSWCTASVRADHLELTITMASSTALRLIEEKARTARLTSENFASLRASLVKAASELCVLTAGKTTLPAEKVQAEFTDEDDVVFKLIYPRPVPGPLRFHSAFLVKLGGNYGAIFEVSDTSGNHLGWDQLNAENPNLDVTVLAHVSSKKT